MDIYGHTITWILPCPRWLLCSTTFNWLFLVLLLCILVRKPARWLYLCSILFAVLFLQVMAQYSKNKSKEDAASTASAVLEMAKKRPYAKLAKKKE